MGHKSKAETQRRGKPHISAFLDAFLPVRKQVVIQLKVNPTQNRKFCKKNQQ